MGKFTKVDSLLVLRASEKRFRSGEDGESRSNCSVRSCQYSQPTFTFLTGGIIFTYVYLAWVGAADTETSSF